MKKVYVLFVFLAILPAVAFAQLSLGTAVFFKSPVLIGQEIDVSNLNVNQFSFGISGRYRIQWFQVDSLLLYSAGEVHTLDLFLDLGPAIDISILTLSLGLGPNFAINFGETSPVYAGLNAKVSADIQLDRMAIGLSYIMAIDRSFDRFNLEKSSGLLGAQILFQL